MVSSGRLRCKPFPVPGFGPWVIFIANITICYFKDTMPDRWMSADAFSAAQKTRGAVAACLGTLSMLLAIDAPAVFVFGSIETVLLGFSDMAVVL